MLKRNLFIAVLASICTLATAQQDKSQRPSPPAQAQCKLSDGKTITVDYSSPRAKGRKIMGGLVPYGEVWRTGANEATTFVTSTDLTVAGKDIPAGSYTIFTVPTADSWTLIINKHTGEWGIPYQHEADELTRTTLTVLPLTSPVENFTIMFDQRRGGCVLNLRWENTEASGLVVETK